MFVQRSETTINTKITAADRFTTVYNAIALYHVKVNLNQVLKKYHNVIATFN